MNIVIFGAGANGRSLAKYFEKRTDYNIIGYADNKLGGAGWKVSCISTY